MLISVGVFFVVFATLSSVSQIPRSISPAAEEKRRLLVRSHVAPVLCNLSPSLRGLEGVWRTVINSAAQHADTGERYPGLLNSHYGAAVM